MNQITDRLTRGFWRCPYYGTTETGVNVIATPEDLRTHSDSVGRAFDGNKLVILDAVGRPLPAGETGRVAIASYMNMERYVDGQADSVEIGEERYLITTDTGRLDAEGRLFLINRAIANKIGTIPFYKLENDLRSLPCIADAAIVPCRDATDAIRVAVVLHRKNATPVSHLIDRIRSLVAFKRIEIDRIALLEHIPYSPSGKLRISELTGMAA